MVAGIGKCDAYMGGSAVFNRVIDGFLRNAIEVRGDAVVLHQHRLFAVKAGTKF